MVAKGTLWQKNHAKPMWCYCDVIKLCLIPNKKYWLSSFISLHFQLSGTSRYLWRTRPSQSVTYSVCWTFVGVWRKTASRAAWTCTTGKCRPRIKKDGWNRGSRRYISNINYVQGLGSLSKCERYTVYEFFFSGVCRSLMLECIFLSQYKLMIDDFFQRHLKL